MFSKIFFRAPRLSIATSPHCLAPLSFSFFAALGSFYAVITADPAFAAPPKSVVVPVSPNAETNPPAILDAARSLPRESQKDSDKNKADFAKIQTWLIAQQQKITFGQYTSLADAAGFLQSSHVQNSKTGSALSDVTPLTALSLREEVMLLDDVYFAIPAERRAKFPFVLRNLSSNSPSDVYTFCQIMRSADDASLFFDLQQEKSLTKEVFSVLEKNGPAQFCTGGYTGHAHAPSENAHTYLAARLVESPASDMREAAFPFLSAQQQTHYRRLGLVPILSSSPATPDHKLYTSSELQNIFDGLRKQVEIPREQVYRETSYPFGTLFLLAKHPNTSADLLQTLAQRAGVGGRIVANDLTLALVENPNMPLSMLDSWLSKGDVVIKQAIVDRLGDASQNLYSTASFTSMQKVANSLFTSLQCDDTSNRYSSDVIAFLQKNMGSVDVVALSQRNEMCLSLASSPLLNAKSYKSVTSAAIYEDTYSLWVALLQNPRTSTSDLRALLDRLAGVLQRENAGLADTATDASSTPVDVAAYGVLLQIAEHPLLDDTLAERLRVIAQKERLSSLFDALAQYHIRQYQRRPVSKNEKIAKLSKPTNNQLDAILYFAESTDPKIRKIVQDSLSSTEQEIYKKLQDTKTTSAILDEISSKTLEAIKQSNTKTFPQNYGYRLSLLTQHPNTSIKSLLAIIESTAADRLPKHPLFGWHDEKRNIYILQGLYQSQKSKAGTTGTVPEVIMIAFAEHPDAKVRRLVAADLPEPLQTRYYALGAGENLSYPEYEPYDTTLTPDKLKELYQESGFFTRYLIAFHNGTPEDFLPTIARSDDPVIRHVLTKRSYVPLPVLEILVKDRDPDMLYRLSKLSIHTAKTASWLLQSALQIQDADTLLNIIPRAHVSYSPVLPDYLSDEEKSEYIHMAKDQEEAEREALRTATPEERAEAMSEKKARAQILRDIEKAKILLAKHPSVEVRASLASLAYPLPSDALTTLLDDPSDLVRGIVASRKSLTEAQQARFATDTSPIVLQGLLRSRTLSASMFEQLKQSADKMDPSGALLGDFVHIVFNSWNDPNQGTAPVTKDNEQILRILQKDMRIPVRIAVAESMLILYPAAIEEKAATIPTAQADQLRHPQYEILQQLARDPSILVRQAFAKRLFILTETAFDAWSIKAVDAALDVLCQDPSGSVRMILAENGDMPVRDSKTTIASRLKDDADERIQAILQGEPPPKK